MSVLVPVLSTLVAAVGGTWLTRRYALRFDVLDVPNARSSHSIPTPRGGGLVLAVAWLLIGFWLLGSDVLPPRLSLALLGGAAIAALVGWWDDHRELSRRLRFALQLLAAVLAVVLVDGLTTVRLGAVTLSLGFVGSLLAVLGTVWLINLYNFMDGIDGLAGLEALTTATFIGLVFHTGGESALATLSWTLAAASLGFLVWNWPPAKIFMGDVGSGFLGYAFAALALVAETTTDVPMLVVLLPLSVFVVDATYTLFRRLLRGEKVYEAHRSHVYQRLVQRGWSHVQVDFAVLGLNIVLCAIAWAMWRNPAITPVALPGALLLVVVAGAVALKLTPKHSTNRNAELASPDALSSQTS